jgi:hypothetical protein
MDTNVLDEPAAASTQKMEAACFSETFVPVYQSTLNHILEYCSLNTVRNCYILSRIYFLCNGQLNSCL